MDVDRWRRVEQVLDVALTREPDQWPSLLDEACSGDPELRREVEALLGRLDTARRFLESPPAALAAAILAETGEPGVPRQEGRRIGAYCIIREIGSGGMSRVFLAERADGQYQQQVALKLLRPGLDSDLDQERFRTERQILATLNHPNIGRLLDGGVTDEGRPYLVLEFVDGESIDRFCDQRSLSLPQRLELFLTVLDATQYAHRNLVIHRDLKPSNILISSAGQVKLLDFGIAKLLDPVAVPGDAAVTRTGVTAMTPEYAAPEQVRGGPVSTATDVYALGVLLYALLTGRRPYEVQGRSPAEVERIVCEKEPTRPSSAFEDAQLNSDRSERARVRGTTPERLRRHLRGDLDAIVLLALRKEPNRRYGSAEQLARDILRYLEGRPVLAHRGNRRYRLGKLVRRHRLETVAALGIALSLVAGAGISLAQARRAAAERDRAEKAFRESRAAWQESAAVSAFLLGLFEVNDPAEGRGDTLTARELLRRGVARAEQLGRQPAAQARMLEVTGQAYELLGRYTEAHALLKRALALRRSTSPKDGPEVAGTLGHLSDALLRLGRYAEADSAARQALTIQERAPGPGNPIVAQTLHQIASLAIYRGDLAAAEAYHRRGLELRRRVLGPEDSLTAESYLAVGSTLQRQGRLAEAEPEFRRALAIFERVLGPDHPEVADALLHIAYLLDEDRTRHAEVEPLYRRALEIRRHTFGDGHPQVAYALGDLGSSLARRGDYATALPLARQQLAILRRALGSEHPVVITSTAHVAEALYGAGALDEAETLYRQAIALERRIRGADHANIAGHEMGLARLLIGRGDFPAAETLLREAIRIQERSSGPEHPNTASAYGLFGMLLTRQGDYSAADSVLRHSIRIIERQVSREHRDVRQLYGWLADLYDAWGRPKEATPFRVIANGR